MTVTWEDFIELMDKTNHEINEMTEALEKIMASLVSLSNTYQELIDYCEKNTDKKTK